MKRLCVTLVFLGIALPTFAQVAKPDVRTVQSPPQFQSGLSSTDIIPADPSSPSADTDSSPFDFSSVEPIRIRDLTPLEQQIHDLEWQQQNYGKPTPPDDETFMRVKLELAELYDQLHRTVDPLDDGADACPAQDLPGNILPYTDFGTTLGAANNFSPSAPCPANTAPDKIYRLIPDHTGFYVFDTFGSDFDTQIYVNTDGVCPGTTQVACNDDFGGSQSQVTVLLNGGQAYYVIVDGFQTYSGNYVLHMTGNCLLGNASDWQQECAESVGDPTHAAWDCNGGCNNQWYGGFPQWQGMNHCQWMRGNCFTYQDPNNISIRDIDSYYFTITESCSLNLSLFSSFSYNIIITDYGFCLPTLYLSLLNIPACNGGSYITQCLPAGTYSIEVSPNFYSGMTTPQGYIINVEPIPCSGCRVDGNFIAPSSFLASGCAGGSENSLRPSYDATYCVIIPYASDWTFSVCGSSPWNSYMYITSECNGGIIAQDDDGCDANGLSKIECLTLMPGNYYLTVEGFGPTDCDQFYMTVTECLGSCCYGNDPYNMQCSYGSLSSCSILSGEFTLGQQCTPEVCGVRPQCEDSSQFSQLPHLPTETWTAIASDVYPGYTLWEDYSVNGVISSVRFWGLFTDYTNGQPCINQPCAFQITFVDSANGPAVQTYNASATGYLMPQNYGPNFPVYQYDVDLPTNCTILSGRIGIQSTDGDPCVFAWVSSPQGNGSVILHHPGDPVDLPLDMSLCLSRGCAAPDSMVISVFQTDWYDIRFHLPEASYVTLYYTTDPNAAYPTNYAPIAGASLTAGYWLYQHNTLGPQGRYVLVAQCGPPPILTVESAGQFQMWDQ